MSLRTRPRVAVVVGAALALAAVPAADSSSAPFPTAGEPDCVASGPLLRYLVLFDPGVPEARTVPPIKAACGAPTAYYPQIGVMVATSADPGFAARIGTHRAYSAQAEALNPPRLGPPGGAPLATDLDTSAPRRGLAALQVPPTTLQVPPTTLHVPSATLQEPPTPAERAVRFNADRSGEQWDMELVRAPQARTIDPGNPDVVVGVLDSGIDASHPELAHAVDPARSAGCLTGRPDQQQGAWRPSSSSHGTHVAGTIAAADDGRGITGVAPGVRVASIKVVDDDGFIYPEYAVCGFMWAATHHIRIANSSYSVDPWLLTCADVPGQAVVHEAVRRAVHYASSQGVLTIAATGNDAMDLANARHDPHSPDNAARPVPRPVSADCHVLPAQLPGVVAVSSIGADGLKSSFSSYGLGVVDVTAPGGDRNQRTASSSSGCVLSTIPEGYGYACGTSMAAPHASGVAALLASTRPDADAEELATLLTEQADPLPCPRHDGPDQDGSIDTCAEDPSGERNSYTGHGVVDALDAVTSGASSAVSDPPPWTALRPAA